jgi:hypothetical protein
MPRTSEPRSRREEREEECGKCAAGCLKDYLLHNICVGCKWQNLRLRYSPSHCCSRGSCGWRRINRYQASRGGTVRCHRQPCICGSCRILFHQLSSPRTRLDKQRGTGEFPGRGSSVSLSGSYTSRTVCLPSQPRTEGGDSCPAATGAVSPNRFSRSSAQTLP